MQESIEMDPERRHQTLQVLELLMDLIHGDIVRDDAVCRRVADAFIVQYEDPIRWMAAHDTSLPPMLQGGLNTYCARHVLRAAPEILIASKESAAAYWQIAEVLCTTDGFTHIGAAMAAELSHLTRHLETRRFARLLDLMGEAVVMYMANAVQQLQPEPQRNSPLMTCAMRFAEAAERFAPQEANGAECVAHTPTGTTTNTHSTLTPERRSFPSEMRLAMGSPAPEEGWHRAAKAQPQPQPQPPQRKQEQRPESTSRAIRQSDDSILSALGHLSTSSVTNRSSTLLVDDTTHGIHPVAIGAKATRRAPHVAGEHITPERSSPNHSYVSGDQQSHRGSRKRKDGSGRVDLSPPTRMGEGEVRQYFLCAETQRYEPAAVRGFYP